MKHISKEELKFMGDILMNNGSIDPTLIGSLSLDHTSWLNGWADRGYWAYGLTIQGGWLTPDGKEFFIEVLWENEMPTASTRMEQVWEGRAHAMQGTAHELFKILRFAKDKLKQRGDNLSIDMIDQMEKKITWPDSAVAEAKT